ncbi:MAG: PIN domain nuclease [Rhodothermales bacterium]|nr:PIN domain nuclease [Rhodothermales bacterium]
MTVVDSSVWIDYFNGTSANQVDQLEVLVREDEVLVGDVVALEVLRGFRRGDDYATARRLLSLFPSASMLGPERTDRAANRYRELRRLGVTPKNTVDLIIASYCIDEGLPLLHADRDYDPFTEHLGLRTA